MNQVQSGLSETITIHWPEPAHLRLDSPFGAPESCEIEFLDGSTERGQLLRFTGREDHLVFRSDGADRASQRTVVRNGLFKRLRLTTPVAARPIDMSILGGSETTLSQVHVYNVEFSDHEIESGNTLGYVRNNIGLFLYAGKPNDTLERVFVPETAIAYFQAGDPIGRVLVEENAVSEEQLQAAVEKQQELRKAVLGDYLIDEGLITPEQLDTALAHQRTKPSLRLGEALIEMKAIQPEALQIALSRQRANRGRPLGQILVDMGVVSTDTLHKIHAKKLGQHFVSLANFSASTEAIEAIDGATAHRLGIVPLSIEHGDLIVAAEQRLDAPAVNELTLSTRMRIVQVLAAPAEIVERRREAYGDADDDLYADGLMFEEPVELSAVGEDDPFADDAHFQESLDGLTDPHLLEVVSRAIHAVESGGTVDIRIVARGGERTTQIRYRRD